MNYMVVINMKNQNALISMAIVSQNANNPYSVFCEYLKYCIFVNTSDVMSITDIRTAVSNEFGIFIPYNIAIKCLSIIVDEGIIEYSDHQVRRTGEYNIDLFNRERDAYRKTETELIDALVGYVAQYGLDWSFQFARDQLIRVLDKNGLAYDIFIHDKQNCSENAQPDICAEDINELLPDEDAIEEDNEEAHQLYSDSQFVGRFIEQVLSEDSVYKEYIHRICEGLMLCVGVYQLPSAGTQAAIPQIRNTGFYFDTRLLLRFLGCAGKAAVEGAKELVSLIQSKGGLIYYYPQTLEEMERAFDEAIQYLTNGYPPKDEEMRLYALQIKNNVTIMRSKRASLKDELAQSKIYIRSHDTFSDADRLRFGFDIKDLQLFMRKNLRWDQQTIENDAFSLWETHMRRQGNYSEYCGSQLQLPVFVTTNSRLIGIALEYRNERQSINAIHGWKHNRLPVITDIRLACRLWVPSEQSSRLSLLLLTANAVAAQRPTRRYLDTVRNLAIEIEKTVPEYSGIPLPAFFEDNVTDALLEKTMGAEEKLNLGTFASSLEELSEWRAKEQEEVTNQVRTERDEKAEKLALQTKNIIDGAVESNKNKLGLVGVKLELILLWPLIVTALFAGVGALLSLIIGSWSILLIMFLPILAKIIELICASNYIAKKILKRYLQKAEIKFKNRVLKKLRPVELAYQDEIFRRVKEETSLWTKCTALIEK